MKVWPAGPFWALRPQFTARRLELACWFIGIVLATALVAATNTSDVGASSASATGGLSRGPAVSGLAAPDASAAKYATSPTERQTRCIKRVMALIAYWPHLDVGKQIERQCLMRPKRHDGQAHLDGDGLHANLGLAARERVCTSGRLPELIRRAP
jgi:hypothetical protein